MTKPNHFCYMKEAYPTVKMANRVAEKAKEKRGVKLYVYLCGNHFHLTSKTPKNI